MTKRTDPPFDIDAAREHWLMIERDLRETLAGDIPSRLVAEIWRQREEQALATADILAAIQQVTK